MRVGILECDHVDPPYRAIDGDYVDMFAALLGRAGKELGIDVEVVAYDVVRGELPATPDECDAWLATGSRRSVYDREEWIAAAAAFVRAIRAAGAPYAGICFGHQLLAHALGGRVERAASGWGAGAIDTALDTAPDVHGAGAVLLYMHQDQVVTLPDGARVVGRTDHCPVAAFEVGGMLGVQAHPEFSVDYVAALLDARVERIGPDATAKARAGLARVADRADSDAVGRWIVRFLADSR